VEEKVVDEVASSFDLQCLVDAAAADAAVPGVDVKPVSGVQAPAVERKG
jgi:hypothetical protein